MTTDDILALLQNAQRQLSNDDFMALLFRVSRHIGFLRANRIALKDDLIALISNKNLRDDQIGALIKLVKCI